MAKRGRPRTADICRCEFVSSGKTYVCQRRRGHTKKHRQGAVRWPQVKGARSDNG